MWLLVRAGFLHSAGYEEEAEGGEFFDALGFALGLGLCRRATAARMLRTCTWKYMDLAKTESRPIIRRWLEALGRESAEEQSKLT